MATTPEMILDKLSHLFTAFNVKATREMFEVYLQVLASASVDDVIWAIDKVLASSREHCPRPGQILQESKQRHGSIAHLAWDVYASTQRRIGAEYGVDFEDGVINATVRGLGGWAACCRVPDEEFNTWHKKAFIEEYERLSTCDLHPSRLLGTGGSMPANFQGTRIHRIGSPYVPAITTATPNQRAITNAEDNQ